MQPIDAAGVAGAAGAAVTTRSPVARAFAKAFAGAREAVDDLLGQPRHELAMRLTLLLLILYGSTGWVLDVPLRILCGTMLVSARLMRSPLLWIAVAAAVVWVNSQAWYSIDNHKYLITYWCLVIALATGSTEPDRVMSVNGRVIIGLCFLFAMVWKVTGGGYFDGSFLHYTLLKDSRIEALAMGLGGIDRSALSHNRALLQVLKTVPGDGVAVTLASSDALRWTAIGLSYWTLLIEGSVAAAFLVNPARRFARWRDGLLMAFVATTYFILPVTGFAFALALLGFAQCEVDRRRTRLVYLMLFVAIQLTRVPWDDYVAQWIE